MPDLATLRLNYSIRRLFVDEFMMQQAALLPSGCLVLDLGGHKVRKRGYFDSGHYDIKVTHLNITTDKLPDIQADGAQLPLASESFDAVICAEVLEHVPDPRLLIEEAYRVLRPGGRFLATVPFLNHIHADPYDFGRYTDYYWNAVLRQRGFTTVEITRHGLFYAVMLDFCKLYLSKVGDTSPMWTIIRRILSLSLLAPLQLGFLRYEQRPAVKNDPFISSFTTGFGIMAIKPQQSAKIGNRSDLG